MLKRVDDFFSAIGAWIFETVALVLLPIIVYAIIFRFFEQSIDELKRIPEWMFASVMLFGDASKRLIMLCGTGVSEHRESRPSLAFVLPGFVGVVISVLFLAFSVAIQIEKWGAPGMWFYDVQVLIFLFSVLYSAVVSVWVALAIKKAQARPAFSG